MRNTVLIETQAKTDKRPMPPEIIISDISDTNTIFLKKCLHVYSITDIK